MTTDQGALFGSCYECDFDLHRCRTCGTWTEHGWWLCPEHRPAKAATS
jgi:hypothetical protein